MLNPSIIFEDQHLAVVDKPAGLLSQGEHTGDENLVDWLRGYFGRNYVGLVHRLDRNTSGVMVVAKRTKAAQRLTDSLQDGSLERVYQAWLCGRLSAPARWEHWLLKDEKTNTVKAVSPSVRGAKCSALQVSPIRAALYKGQEVTLAEFRLETGRSHQIRVQASVAGFSLLGDAKYGARGAMTDFGRPALHSWKISFPHPMSKETLQFESPLPKDMLDLVDAG